MGKVDGLGEYGRLGDARLDDHDPDAERRQLLGQALADPLEGPLRRDIGRLRQGGHPPHHRRDVDDGAAAALAHAGQHRLCAANGATQVDVHDVEVVGRAGLLDDTVAADPGVVHQDVDPSGALEDLFEAAPHRLVVGDVELDQLDVDAALGRHRAELGGPGAVPNRPDHRVAPRCEVDCGGAPDARVRARHDRYGGHALDSNGRLRHR